MKTNTTLVNILTPAMLKSIGATQVKMVNQNTAHIDCYPFGESETNRIVITLNEDGCFIEGHKVEITGIAYGVAPVDVSQVIADLGTEPQPQAEKPFRNPL
jgi:hypothetical protein